MEFIVGNVSVQLNIISNMISGFFLFLVNTERWPGMWYGQPKCGPSIVGQVHAHQGEWVQFWSTWKTIEAVVVVVVGEWWRWWWNALRTIRSDSKLQHQCTINKFIGGGTWKCVRAQVANFPHQEGVLFVLSSSTEWPGKFPVVLEGEFNFVHDSITQIVTKYRANHLIVCKK